MNTIKVLFFGSLEDVVGCKEKALANINTSDELITFQEMLDNLNLGK